MDSSPPLPTFLIIGAQKSATRWLRSNLGKHPEIFTAEEELSFFNQRYRRGTDYYRSLFEGWDGEPISGEATPGYMMWRHNPPRVAKRIHETIPDVRLVALLRDPVERANSAVLHHVKRGRLKKRTRLVTEIEHRDPESDPLCLVSGGWYAASLEPFHKLFGDQLLVILHEDVADDPNDTYDSVLRHIGASPDFVPEDLDAIVFSNRSSTRSTVSDADRRRLWTHFKADVSRLEVAIGRDLATWYPGSRWPEPPDEFVQQYGRVMRWTQSVIDGVRDDQLGNPAPCTDWDVRRLLAYLVELVVFCVDLYRPDGGSSELTDGIITNRLVEPSTAFAEACQILERSLDTQEAWDAESTISGFAMPSTVQLAAFLTNLLVRGWDLGVATEQNVTVPDDLAVFAAAFARELFIKNPFLASMYPEEVPLHQRASASDRLLALHGRDPATALASSEASVR